MTGHWENILDADGWTVSMVDAPPEQFDVNKGFEMVFDLTNNTSNSLDGTSFISVDSISGGLSLNTYVFDPGETKTINFRFPGDPVAPDISNGNTYTFEMGISGPAHLYRFTMDAVEGAEGPTDADPSDINITNASLSPSEVIKGESVTWNATIENTGDVGAEFSLYWAGFPSGSTTRAWAWSAGYSIPANSKDDFELTYTVDDNFWNNIGGEGVYDFEANIDSVDGQGTEIGPVDSGTLTIGSPGSSDIQVDSVVGPDRDPYVGDTVKCIATITNYGDVSGERTFDIYVDASRSGDVTATLDAGQTKEYEITTSARDLNSYTVRVGTESAEINVMQDPAHPSFTVNEIWTPGTTPSPGDQASLEVKISNTGGADGTTNYGISVNGSVTGTLSKSIPSGDTKYFDVSITTPETEQVDVQIGSVSETFSTTYDPGGNGGSGDASFTVESIAAPKDTPSPGDKVSPVTTITNTGDAGGTTSYDVYANGSVVGTIKKTISAGETVNIGTQITVPETEEVTFKVGNKSVTFDTTLKTSGGDTGDDIIQKVKDNKLLVGAAGAAALYALTREDDTVIQRGY